MQFKDIRIHEQQMRIWQTMLDKEVFPHTVMLSGLTEHGSLYTAFRLAQRMLCGENEQCLTQTGKLIHPDLYFVYPSVALKSGSGASSENFQMHWREYFPGHPFGNYSDWMKFLDAGNKQGIIRVQDAENVMRFAYRYPVSAPVKAVIIWLSEKMNGETANKLLKVLEEPPENTYFILVTENEEQNLETVRSRCVIYRIPPVPPGEMIENLQRIYQILPARAKEIAYASEGNWRKAEDIINDKDPYETFKDYFVRWMRIAWKAGKQKSAINDLTAWTEEIAAESKSFQSDFLKFAMETIRQAYMWQQGATELVHLNFDKQNFEMTRFAPFIRDDNIDTFYRLLNEASYHLVRNANPKTTFLDLSIKVTRLLILASRK